MKRAIFLLAAVGLASGATGCCWPHGQCLTGLINGSCQIAPENCAACNAGCDGGGAADCPDSEAVCRAGHGHGGKLNRRQQAWAEAQGPASGAITYPYYTVRGPRDFLAANPRSIGP